MNLLSSVRSLTSRRPRTLILAVTGILSVLFLAPRKGDEGPDPLPDPKASSPIVIAPRVPLRMIFRPLFKTPDHEFAAGAAFLARVPFCSDPILFSALQNIGPAGGYYTQVLGSNLDDMVSGIELREAYTGEKMLSPEIEPLTIPAAAPLGTPSEAGDVAAFRARGSAHLESGFLSEDATPPPPGSHIWLAFGASPSNDVSASGTPDKGLPRIHHGFVTESRDGLLYYTLDDPAVPLRGSCGAPLIAEGGRIVGIHLGATTGGGKTHAIATPVSRFLPALRNACQPAAQTASTGRKAQN
jgi:hypothetical protein